MLETEQRTRQTWSLVSGSLWSNKEKKTIMHTITLTAGGLVRVLQRDRIDRRCRRYYRERNRETEGGIFISRN